MGGIIGAPIAWEYIENVSVDCGESRIGAFIGAEGMARVVEKSEEIGLAGCGIDSRGEYMLLARRDDFMALYWLERSVIEGDRFPARLTRSVCSLISPSKREIETNLSLASPFEKMVIGSPSLESDIGGEKIDRSAELSTPCCRPFSC